MSIHFWSHFQLHHPFIYGNLSDFLYQMCKKIHLVFVQVTVFSVDSPAWSHRVWQPSCSWCNDEGVLKIVVMLQFCPSSLLWAVIMCFFTTNLPWFIFLFVTCICHGLFWCCCCWYPLLPCLFHTMAVLLWAFQQGSLKWVVYAHPLVCCAYITFTYLPILNIWIYVYLTSFHIYLYHLFKIKWIKKKPLLSALEIWNLTVSGSLLQTAFLVVIFSVRTLTLLCLCHKVVF